MNSQRVVLNYINMEDIVINSKNIVLKLSNPKKEKNASNVIFEINRNDDKFNLIANYARLGKRTSLVLLKDISIESSAVLSEFLFNLSFKKGCLYKYILDSEFIMFENIYLKIKLASRAAFVELYKCGIDTSNLKGEKFVWYNDKFLSNREVDLSYNIGELEKPYLPVACTSEFKTNDSCKVFGKKELLKRYIKIEEKDLIKKLHNVFLKFKFKK